MVVKINDIMLDFFQMVISYAIPTMNPLALLGK